MAARTLPIEMDIAIFAGATYVAEYRWRPDGTTGQDFAGWSARMLLGPRHGAALLQPSTSNGQITLSTDGVIHVEIPAADTATLRQPILAYTLDLTDPLTRTIRFLRGAVTVQRDVEPAP
jgi:hypothetical protein